MKKTTIVIILILSIFCSTLVSSSSYSINNEYINSIYDFISSKYQFGVTEDELFGGSLNGILIDTNQYSCFEEYSDIFDRTINTWGITVEKVRDGFIVSSVAAGSNAYSNGIDVGDIIYSFNRQNASTMNVNALETVMASNEGKTDIKFYDISENKNINTTIYQSKGYLTSVDFCILNDVGYIRILQYDDQTKTEVLSALNYFEVNKTSDIILDLRDSISMNIKIASEIADIFMPYGTIAVTHQKTYAASFKRDFVSVNAIINENSSGAAEIIASGIINTNSGTVYGTSSMGESVSIKQYPVFLEAVYQKYSINLDTDSVAAIANHFKINNIELNQDNISGYINIVDGIIYDMKNNNLQKGVSPNVELNNTKMEYIQYNPYSNSIWIRDDFIEGTVSYEVFTAEKILKELGFFEGEANAVFDEYTKSCINSYKKSIGLSEDGILDMYTQKTLNIINFKEYILKDSCIEELLDLL